jgi:tRNA-dihydrouridine synthase B
VRDALPHHATTTVSMRRGFDDTPESTDRFHEIVQTSWDNGYAAVRVHGRTVEQKYLGQAHWPALRDVKQRYPDRTILGSGDVFTAHDVLRMREETGVDVVWIARGAIGNPWIFRDAARLLADPTATLAPPTIPEQREALAEHFSIAMQIHGEQLAGRRMRKMGIKYSRFHPRASQVKSEFIAVKSLRDWTGVLEKWYCGDGPGVWPDRNAADEVNQFSAEAGPQPVE